MKIFKKVLVILLIAALYFNIGYYYGKSAADARIKFCKNEPLNSFQKFQLGGWKIFRPWSENFNDPAEVRSEMKWAKIVSSLIWPFVIFMISLTWIIYGIAQAAGGIWSAIVFLGIQIWHVLVFLFNFFSCGGLVKLIGIYWILTIASFVAGIMLFRWGTKIEKKYKLTVSCGRPFSLMPTVMCGVACSLSLAFGAPTDIWWMFYAVWILYLLLSFILNLCKK